MSTDFEKLFAELDRHSEPVKREEILKAPFGYPGGKSRSVEKLMALIPYKNTYVEPFGGSAAILLSRRPSNIEVYNDRFGGVVDFYRCIKDPKSLTRLISILDSTVHSREDFLNCRDTWADHEDIVERAARWYYMTTYSFSKLGRNFGRATSGKNPLSGLIRDKLVDFHGIHSRLKNVLIENSDWYQLCKDYDSYDTVIYMDPPYVDASSGIYKWEMDHQQHRNLIGWVQQCKSTVIISGYANPVYDNCKWDARHQWEVNCSMKSMAFTEENNKLDHKDVTTNREKATEVAWIKY